jgi:hypothetical protein
MGYPAVLLVFMVSASDIPGADVGSWHGRAQD